MVPKNICIAFLGFDSDRIYLPVRMLKCDKLYLIRRPEDDEHENATYNYRLIIKNLPKGMVHEVSVSHGHLFERVNAVKKIFETERENQIYINLSTGSKLDAIAGMFAVMLFRKDVKREVVPFYAEPDDTGRVEQGSGKSVKKTDMKMKKINYSETRGVQSIEDIWVLDLQAPKGPMIQALKIISDHGGKIKKKELVLELCRQGLLEGLKVDDDRIVRIHEKTTGPKAIRNAQSNAFHIAENGIIRELKGRWKAIEEDEEKTKNKTIQLRQNGKYLVTIFFGN